jgi:hypothetical protein
MQSEIEKYVSQKLRELREAISHRDRGVVVGAVLSFIPIFPACTIGVFISVGNFVLIRKARLDRSDENLVKISLAVGFLNSILWIYILLHIGGGLFATIGYISDFLTAPLNIFDFDSMEYDGVNGFRTFGW